MRKTTSPIDRLMRRVVSTPGPLPTECWVPTFRPLTDTCRRGHSIKDAPDYGKGRRCRECSAMHAREYRTASA